ncbi:MAG: tetraacyldisaccharide 4'-kinase [Chitinophagales bacterium]|nr:tetraacyldisaccharide 4'-kinase [Chitinophagales bacterium]MDW8418655.1 tetraacyldisaccharide 4'-kinase [Chitinophagales bacterium]
MKYLLTPFSWIYGLLTGLRNYLYDKRILKSVRFDYPVICIGNLSTGGTGKTPMLIYLLHLLQYTHMVATLSRGYGRRTSGFRVVKFNDKAENVGDEPLMIKRQFREVMVTVGEERVTAIPEILQLAPETDVIIMDDAFQHRSVRPGLSVLLTSYHSPFFSDYLLPRGNLREGRAQYRRADIIVVTQCPPHLTVAEKLRWQQRIKPYRFQKIYFTSYEYGPMYSFYEREWLYDLTPDTHVLLLCGIANPEGLFSHLSRLARKVYLRRFRDHHLYDTNDLDSVYETWKHLPGERKVIITTEKDAVRLLPYRDWLLAHNLGVVVQPIAMKFLFDEGPAFDRDILRYIDWEKTRLIGQQL